MILPYRPEPPGRLRRRYPTALVRTFDLAAMERGADPFPADLRSQVFDFRDGCRLIVSREQEDGRVFLHLWASAAPGTEIWRMIASGEMVRHAFVALVERHFLEISGEAEPPPFHRFSPARGMPHWYRGEKRPEGAGVPR